jgi:hypothetical protein
MVPGLKTKNAISKEGSMTMFQVGECPLDFGSVVFEISGTQAHLCIAEKSQGMLAPSCSQLKLSRSPGLRQFHLGVTGVEIGTVGERQIGEE